MPGWNVQLQSAPQRHVLASRRGGELAVSLSRHKPILKRLAKEFWFPALVAIVWVLYSRSAGHGIADVKGDIAAFAAAFFLASWATGQFFRVQKQTLVDRNLLSIEQRLQGLVSLLEARTEALIGYATGGDSFAQFLPSFNIHSPHVLTLSLENSSKYPVHDIQIEWIDLDEPIDPPNGKFWTRHPIGLASLWPNKAVLDVVRIDLSNRASVRINIFIQSRNSGGIQEIRAVKAPDRLLIASRARMAGVETQRIISPDFPGYDANNPDAVFALTTFP